MKTKERPSKSTPATNGPTDKHWTCACEFKNERHLRFCGQCGTMRPEADIPDDEKVRIDIGCGGNKKAGFLGVDCLPLEGVDVALDICEKITEWRTVADSAGDLREERVHIGYKPWPWDDNSVDEIHCSHVLEHFGEWDRVHLFNEMYRVLKPKATASIQTPYWKSGRAYGDPSHRWAPLSDFSLFYLRRAWRMGGKLDGQDITPQAPHTDASNIPFGYACDFAVRPSYGLAQATMAKSPDAQQFEVTHYVEVALDLLAVLTKIPKSW